jgi:sodium-dependent phosphate transporter
MSFSLIDDVANQWATSVSSRSISYPAAMLLDLIFEVVGATTVGSRNADTIKNGIIPLSAFGGNAGVQMLGFTCAVAAAGAWVLWCTRHSAHVSSTYSLISAVAGVGVALAGANNVQWGWNGGQGMGAIFSGLVMAPVVSAGFGATIFLLIKYLVHARKNPALWAVYTSPFWFLIASTICTLSIVYKGSPSLGLDKKEPWYIATVALGTGFGVALLSALFFMPYIYTVIIKKDYTLPWYMFVLGPLLYRRPAPEDADAHAPNVPKYAVVQHDAELSTEEATADGSSEKKTDGEESTSIKGAVVAEVKEKTYEELVAEGEARLHAKLRTKSGPIGWAMRYLHNNPYGRGRIYEWHNMVIAVKRVPAMITVALLYGVNYDIHAAQVGVQGTPDGERMARVYSYAIKYPDEVEHTYSFIQIITACTAAFAHGANDVGNSVGPWAVIYTAWSTGDVTKAKATVEVWQLAVMSLTISFGLLTYGYNIMKGKICARRLPTPLCVRSFVLTKLLRF